MHKYGWVLRQISLGVWVFLHTLEPISETSHLRFVREKLLRWLAWSDLVAQKSARSIFGVDSYESGSVKINNKPLKKNSPITAMAEKDGTCS